MACNGARTLGGLVKSFQCSCLHSHWPKFGKCFAVRTPKDSYILIPVILTYSQRTEKPGSKVKSGMASPVTPARSTFPAVQPQSYRCKGRKRARKVYVNEPLWPSTDKWIEQRIVTPLSLTATKN